MAIMGRPRTLDRDLAIAEVRHIFWQNGHESTSSNQLKTGIDHGMTPPGFHAACDARADHVFMSVPSSKNAGCE